MLDIANEYGYLPRPLSFADFYAVSSASEFETNDASVGVGGGGSPNVPSVGAISFSNFHAQSKRSATLVSFPPAISATPYAVGGFTYRTSASTNRASTLASWGVFNGLAATGPYDNNKWQSNDGCYDATTYVAKNNPTINGFDPGYDGQWICLTMPYAMYLAGFTIGGAMIDFRLYATISPSNPDSWALVHSVTNLSGTYVTDRSYALLLTGPYIAFAIKIGKSMQPAGFGRGCMRKILFSGYRA